MLTFLHEGSAPPFPPSQLAKALCQLRSTLAAQMRAIKIVLPSSAALFARPTPTTLPLERREPHSSLGDVAQGLAVQLTSSAPNLEPFPVSEGWYRSTMHQYLVAAALRYRSLEEEHKGALMSSSRYVQLNSYISASGRRLEKLAEAAGAVDSRWTTPLVDAVDYHVLNRGDKHHPAGEAAEGFIVLGGRIPS
jgi:hypothetical protein